MSVKRGGIALLVALATTAAIAAAFSGRAAPERASAASHREAPLISLDPAADISDFFMFRSYEPGHENNVVLIMNVNPGEEPSSGPNYYGFDPTVTYSFEIDNDRDGVADDVRFDFTFDTKIEGLVQDLDLPLAYVGGINGLPAVTDVDSPGNGVRQRYDVTMSVNGGKADKLNQGKLPVLPNNVGPRTTPNYEANFLSEGVKSLNGGVRVFAGPRDDPFFIDLGAVFDTLNLRPIFGTAPGSGIDMLAGYNVHTIALEVPMAMISNGSNTIGAYAFTSRNKVRVLGGKDQGPLVQVQRLANPLVNEVIIPTERKDEWNAKSPEQEIDFLSYYLKPRIALAAQIVFGINTGCLVALVNCAPNPHGPGTPPALAEFNRNDLQAVLLQYNGLVYGSGTAGVDSDLLRLNLGIAPTPLGSQSSVPGVLGGDNAAWPNGRRPNDDVTDIAVKAVGGPNYLGLATVDGVYANDVATTASFPFLAAPHDGVTRVHVNP